MVRRSSLAGASAGETGGGGGCSAGARPLAGSDVPATLVSALSLLSAGSDPGSVGAGGAPRSRASSIADKAAVAASWIFPDFAIINTPGDHTGRRFTSTLPERSGHMGASEQPPPAPDRPGAKD